MSVFLEVSDDDKIYSGVNFFLIKDRFPVSPGHILIISKELKMQLELIAENKRSPFAAAEYLLSLHKKRS